MSKLSIHREINSSIIPFEQEALMNVFYGLIKKFNKEIDKSIIELSKMDLWALLGYNNKNYNTEEIKKIIKQLTKSGTYEIPENQSKISGSIFVIEELENTIKIEIPSTFKKYIFTQKDIDLIVKAKHKKKMDIKELDYWDNTLKTKKKSLVLLKEADIFNIKGKYAKRLYTLLAQNPLSKDFKIELNKFRDILEIPEGYKMGNIDQKVLNPALKEIEEKTDIMNIKIEKIKNGRNIDKLIFTFMVKESILEKNNEPNNEENMEQVEEEFSVEKSEIAEDIKELKSKLKRKLKGNVELSFALAGITTLEKLNEFIEKYQLKID